MCTAKLIRSAAARIIGVSLMISAWDVAALRGQANADTLLVLGAGNAGPWVTEYVLTNAGSTPADLAIMGGGPEFHICPLVECADQTVVTVLPNSTSVVPGPRFGFPLFFLRSIAGPQTAVRARIYNAMNPSQGADLPVFRVATLQALNVNELVFPIRPGATRSNLLLVNIRDAGQTLGGDTFVRVRAYSATGEQLGSRDLVLPFGQATYVVDIGRYIGIGNLGDGHIRVERLGGTGVFWGVLPSLNVDGSLTVSLGYVS